MIFLGNKRLTEPYSFIFLKKLCSFSFIILLIYYTCYQFLQFHNSISKPNLIISEYSHLDDKFTNINITISICGPNVNCTYKVAYTYDAQDEECNMANKLPFELGHPGNCPRYSFAYYHHDEIEIAISPNITSVHLDGLEIDKYYQSDMFPSNSSNLIYHSKEQTTIVYYSPTIIKQIFSRYAYGLAGGKETEYVNFNTYMDHITSTTPDKTMLILRPISRNIYSQEETYYDLFSIISNIGGFFSSLSGIYVFLFGAYKLAPWGFLQIYVFSYLCTGYRREFIRKLKNKYDPIPFVSGRAKNVTLEERVQSIENLLEEYYLNTDFLNLSLKDNSEKKIPSENPRSIPEVIDDEIDDKVQIITAA